MTKTFTKPRGYFHTQVALRWKPHMRPGSLNDIMVVLSLSGQTMGQPLIKGHDCSFRILSNPFIKPIYFSNII
jgi:hypothetical protein